MSLLQKIAARAGVTTRHVERLLRERPIRGVTRRGRRGHWRAIGPVSRQRVDRLVVSLGLTLGGKHGAKDNPLSPERLRTIDAALAFHAAQKGQTSQDDHEWTTDEDWNTPFAQSIRATRLPEVLSHGVEFAEAAACAMRIHNRGGRITREKLATEQGMSVATHRRKFTPAQFKSIKGTALVPQSGPRAEGQGAAVEFLTQKLYKMLTTAPEDDSPLALAEFCGMRWVEFCSRYPRTQIAAAYSAVDRLQIESGSEPDASEFRDDVGLGYDAVEADEKRFRDDAERLVGR